MHDKLIVIEGGDASGKGTQVELLMDALREEGNTVTLFDFPQYTKTLYGKNLQRALKGKHGDFKTISPWITSALYSLDRACAKEDMQNALEQGIVVCDRYVPSNIAFQSAKLPEDQREDFIVYLERGEYVELKLPIPDLVLYLDVPFGVSKKLMIERQKKGGPGKDKPDLHEADSAYQKEVRKMYRTLAEERAHWYVVDCTHDDALLPRDKIHEKIMEKVQTIML